MSTTMREVDGRMTTTPRYVGDTAPGYYPTEEEGAGWLTFAAVMLGFGGFFGLLDGIIAVSRSSFYVAGAHFVFSDLNTWGWITMVVGAVALIASFGVLTGSQFARWGGITAAGLQALAQLLMIQAYPFWSLCLFAIDALVIFALAVYGGQRRSGSA